jgi:hypothetical protein
MQITLGCRRSDKRHSTGSHDIPRDICGDGEVCHVSPVGSEERRQHASQQEVARGIGSMEDEEVKAARRTSRNVARGERPARLSLDRTVCMRACRSGRKYVRGGEGHIGPKTCFQGAYLACGCYAEVAKQTKRSPSLTAIHPLAETCVKVPC